MLEFDFVSELDIEAPIAIVVGAIDSVSAVEGVEPSSLQRWLAEARRRHFTGKAGEIVELMAETSSALRTVLIVGCADGAFDPRPVRASPSPGPSRANGSRWGHQR